MEDAHKQEKPYIDRIWILALFGGAEQFASVADALAFIDRGKFSNKDFVRIEAQVRYTDGFHVDVAGDTQRVRSFLVKLEQEF